MPEDNIPPVSDAAKSSPAAADASADAKKSKVITDSSKVTSEIVSKINDAQNILIALSSNPSVDEMAAAIGLSLFLDKIGKRATAIYSGATPNALEFLKPEETFEPTIDALQDFVIALSKEKADHLRYKLDGEFVKIYITPYKTRISEEDLDYSYGDFNVDLVIALDVANGVDLDEALREHGRIMHDAVIVNITNGNPGKLGEIEWSDKTASSVSEMVSQLVYNMGDKTGLGSEEATAFLTGIVAATNRFSNDKTTPEVMRISSKLMESGANQQLVSKNINSDSVKEISADSADSEPEKPAENAITEPEVETKTEPKDEEAPVDNTVMSIKHGDQDEVAPEPEAAPEPETSPSIDDSPATDANEPDLLDDLKAAAANLAQTGAETTAEPASEPLKIEDTPQEGFVSDKPEKVLQPSSDSLEGPLAAGSNKYGQMLEEALSSIDTPAPVNSEASSQNPQEIAASEVVNPAAMSAPEVPVNPEINGVPTMNYMPLPGEEILPPPPTPPIDMSAPAPKPQPSPTELPQPTPATPSEPIAPATPPVEPTPTPLGPQPAMQDQVYGPQASDPSAFKIPGM